MRMKLDALAFAVVAGAFVIPDVPGQIPLKTTSSKSGSSSPQFLDPAHHHHEPAWLRFLPGKDALTAAYDEAITYVNSGVDNAANALHSWVDNAVADSVGGGHHGHGDEDYSSRTIYEIINENEHTTRFAKLINDRPHLVELLNSTKTNSTLFVPIDEAFKHVPDDDKHKPSKEFVDDLVLYHIGLGDFPVHKIIDTHTFPTALKDKYLGDEPQRLRVRLGFTGVRINFYSKVVKAVVSAFPVVSSRICLDIFESCDNSSRVANNRLQSGSQKWHCRCHPQYSCTSSADWQGAGPFP